MDDMTIEATGGQAAATWREKVRASLTGEVGYVGMLCSTFFLYLTLAVLALAPINIIGKNSPIQVAAYRNDFLREVIRFIGLDRASALQLQLSAFVVIALLILAYSWAIYIFRNREDKRLGVILSVAAGLCLILVLLPPLFSRDVFSNIYYGKIKVVYGANPYTSSPQRFMGDSILPFTSTYWKNTPIVYGPFYTLFSMGLAKTAGVGVTAGIYASKASLALFHLGNTLLIWTLLGRFYPRRQVLGTMLYAWNPLVLLASAGGGHNDVMMAFFAVLALYLVMSDHPRAAVLSMTLSVMTKYATGILLVALIVYLVRRRALWRDKLKTLAVCLAIVLVVSALLFAPFWEGFSTLRTTFDNLKLHTAFSVGNVARYSFVQVFHHVLRLPLETAENLASSCARALLGLVFLGLFARFTLRCRSREDLLDNWTWILISFILTTSYLFSWYMVWVIPFLAMREWDRLNRFWLMLATCYMFTGNDLAP